MDENVKLLRMMNNSKQDNIKDTININVPTTEEIEEHETETVTYQIRVHRRKSVMSALVAARVLIDGTEVGKVKNGEDAIFEVAPGKHVVLIYAGGERKCGAIFAPDPNGADMIIAPTINAWRMEIVGVLPLPKEELQVKPEELVEKQKLPEMDSATRRQIEHAMYGKRGRRG